MGSSRYQTEYHRRNLPHIEPWDRPVFVTFCTRDRWILPSDARQLVLGHCLHDHGQLLWMHAAVVMPDHVHLLLTPSPPADGTRRPLSRLLQSIKGASAHSVNKLLQRRGPVWQDESFDRIVRSEESLREKAEYIVANPVRKGLADNVDAYPWLWREWVEGSAEA